MSEVEAAFQREKLKLIKKEIVENQCGVVYPADHNFYWAENPDYMSYSMRRQYWNCYIPQKTKRHAFWEK